MERNVKSPENTPFTYFEFVFWCKGGFHKRYSLSHAACPKEELLRQTAKFDLRFGKAKRPKEKNLERKARKKNKNRPT